MSDHDFIFETTKKAIPISGAQLPEALINSVRDKRLVMIGESSHGTREFYHWRQELTKELISRHGFSFVAIEGDWPPAQKVNQFVRSSLPGVASDALLAFDRWPTWMWANVEVVDFIHWLKDWNATVSRPVGFHGLDVYSFYESMDEVVRLLTGISPELAVFARDKYRCLDPYGRDEKAYARSLLRAPSGCEQEVLDVLNTLFQSKLAQDHVDEWFDLRQNAQLVRNAEHYYRSLIFGDEDPWNIREQHMHSTLEGLLHFYGPGAKAVVWAHNTHVGDHRATDMVDRGQVSLGGLGRELFGDTDLSLLGFSTHRGEVTAATEWDGLLQFQKLPPGKSGSVEDLFHQAVGRLKAPGFCLLFDRKDMQSEFLRIRAHRAVGVVYHPEREARLNYVPTSLARRYDGLVYIDETGPIIPLRNPTNYHKIPDTYPFGDRK